MIDSTYLWNVTKSLEIPKQDWVRIVDRFVTDVIEKGYLVPNVKGKITVSEKGTRGLLSYWAMENLLEVAVGGNLVEFFSSLGESQDTMIHDVTESRIWLNSLYNTLMKDPTVRARLRDVAISSATEELNTILAARAKIKENLLTFYDNEFGLPVQFLITKDPAELYYIIGIGMHFISDVTKGEGCGRQVAQVEL